MVQQDKNTHLIFSVAERHGESAPPQFRKSCARARQFWRNLNIRNDQRPLGDSLVLRRR